MNLRWSWGDMGEVREAEGVTDGCEPLTTESSLQSSNYILKGTL